MNFAVNFLATGLFVAYPGASMTIASVIRMKHRLSPSSSLAAAFIGLLAASSSASAATYVIDDNTPTASIGIGLPGFLLNAFQVGTTADSISAVEISFSNVTPPLTAFEIILFSDPNGDGSPRDGVEQARAAVLTPALITPGAFVTYTFNSPVPVSANQWFFAGIVEGSTNINVNRDGTGGLLSYAAWEGSSPSTANQFGTFASFGFANDYMVRAVGIPEPSSLALIGIFTLGGMARRRRL